MTDTATQGQTSGREVQFNGVNGSTGDYLLPPLKVTDLSNYIRKKENLPRKQPVAALAARDQGKNKAFGTSDEVDDPNDVAQAGWGIIFPASLTATELADLREALKPLLDWRRERANSIREGRYQEYAGDRGYVAKQSAADWLGKYHKRLEDAAEPDIVPYYLLLIGSPQQVPFIFQYSLDVVYGVGRLYFDQLPGDNSPADVLARYARYAQSLVEAEKAFERGEGFRARRAVYFGVRNADQDATALSAEELVRPLFDQEKDRRKDWTHELVQPGDAKKDRLVHLLSDDTPGLLFTASHGMGFNLDDKRLEPHTGAILCGEWPGKEEWRGRGQIPPDFYVSADDVCDNADVYGMIAFHFACFGAGSPRLDDFDPYLTGKNREIAPRELVARLPQRLLGHPKGGALAVIGHVDRAWAFSFSTGDVTAQIVTFRDTLGRLMRRETVGQATEVLNARFAAVSTRLTGMLHEATKGTDPDPQGLVDLWTTNNDARSYVVLGDPAVRLPLAKEGGESVAAPQVPFNIPSFTVSSGGAGSTGTSVAGAGDRMSGTTQMASGTAPTPPAGSPAGAPVPVRPSVGPAAIPAPAGSQVGTGVAGGQVVINVFAGGQAAETGAPTPRSYGTALDYGIVDDLGEMRDQISQGIRNFAQQLVNGLQGLVQDIGSLSVVTYTSPDLNKVDFNSARDAFVARPGTDGTVRRRMLTSIRLDGDTIVAVPEDAGQIDQALLAIHSDMVRRGMEHRAELIKMAAEAAGALIKGIGPQ